MTTGGRHGFKRILRIVVLCLIAIPALAFAADYLSLRFDLPHRPPFDSVEIRRFYAVKLKNKQTSYMMSQPQTVECVNSLFPHYGDGPCWYRRSHTLVEVDINAGPAAPFIDTP